MQAYIIHIQIKVQYASQENDAYWQASTDEIFQILEVVHRECKVCLPSFLPDSIASCQLLLLKK